jgi:predicted O-methyltransferase YrrM
MTEQLWDDVDRYLNERLVPPDPALEAALRASEEAGLPSINVTPTQGKLLQILALAIGARNILEVGTLGGYSTIWLARALGAGGRLVTLEADPRHAAVAEANIAAAGLSEVVEIILGPAAETLQRLLAEEKGGFDLVFIDADKATTAEYFAWSVKLSHVGSLVIVDNVVRGGGIASDPVGNDAAVKGMQRFLESLRDGPGVSATAVQTVGSKGYDGFVLALVTGETA